MALARRHAQASGARARPSVADATGRIAPSPDTARRTGGAAASAGASAAARPDPQLNLTTTLTAIADLLRAGDFVTFATRYEYMPPELLAQLQPEQLKQIAEGMAQANIPGTPEYQLMQQMIQALETVKGMESVIRHGGPIWR